MSLTSEVGHYLYLGVTVLLSAFAVASAITIVKQRVVLYSAVALAFLGFAVAGLAALLSPGAYGIYSVFHVLLYVGATVTFIALTIVLFRGIDVKPSPTAGTILGIAVAFLVAVVTVVAVYPVTQGTFSQPQALDLVELANQLLGTYWFPIVVLIVGLVTTVIEALALARRR
jgi:NADH-quinone oxidoreductase subunit J